jgi:hypothetical protein
MIRALADAGGDVNTPDPAGETPLMAAARVGSVDAVTTLLERGAPVDATDAAFKQTALMVAIRENKPEVVRTLIARGANVNAKTRVGQTPPWVLPNSQPGFGHGIDAPDTCGRHKRGLARRVRRVDVGAGVSQRANHRGVAVGRRERDRQDAVAIGLFGIGARFQDRLRELDIVGAHDPVQGRCAVVARDVHIDLLRDERSHGRGIPVHGGVC